MLDHKTLEALSKPSCSVAQAAALLGLSQPGVIRAIERGDIRGTRIGKRIIIPTGPLRKILMLEEPAVPPPTAA